MYSEEILYYLKQKKFLLTVDEYLNIIKSPQIREIKYIDNHFYMSTDDGYNYTFKIIDNKRK